MVKENYPTAIIESTDETGDLVVTRFRINGKVMTLYANLQTKSLTLIDSDKLMVKTIGEQFDRKLSEGKFQDSFGQINLD
ncbi:MAG: hypothetical protein ABIN80_04990 [Dyadobacter sp.]|uniref:hypothetical protein n=1 Tax=Dyadobacter sp. TaxID=1914288 RepID=UPI003263C219